MASSVIFVRDRERCCNFVRPLSSATPSLVISKSERSRVRSCERESKWESPGSVIFRHLERSSTFSREAHPPRTKEDKPPSSKFPQERKTRVVSVFTVPTNARPRLVTLVADKSREVRKPPFAEEKVERTEPS